jgi:flagellar motor switch protein FliM
VSQTDQQEHVEEQGPSPAETPGSGEQPGPEPSAEQAPVARRHESQVRTVDFSQPTKFTTELRRRIERVLGPFCEAFAIRLSTELRAPVELGLADPSQLTWSAAKAQLPADAIAVALEVRPIERLMLLSIEPPMILQALELLLGGTAAQAPPERRLSEIDWALTRRLLESMTTQLTLAWRDLGGLELALGEIDLEGDAGVVAPLGEPTFAVTLQSRIDGLPSAMSLLIPWSAIEPVAEDILGAGTRPEDADPQEGRAVQHGLAGAPVRLRAEVGSLRMPVERMLALTPGTLLTLEDRAEDGVQLYAEGVPLGRAQPGLRGARRAIKLTKAVTPGPAQLMVDPTAGMAHVLAPPDATADTGAEDSRKETAGDDAPADDAANGQGPTSEASPTSETPATPASLTRMMGVPVRVWAELGRTLIALGQALELPPGTVVELDQDAEDPIELFVNGMRFAHGTLQVASEGAWAVRIDTLVSLI